MSLFSPLNVDKTSRPLGVSECVLSFFQYLLDIYELNVKFPGCSVRAARWPIPIRDIRSLDIVLFIVIYFSAVVVNMVEDQDIPTILWLLTAR